MDVPGRRLSIGATGRGRTGNYRLIAPIARGGMGEVYLAETMLASGDRKQVIIKRLLEGLQDDTAHVLMFRSEAEHLSLLDHKNIVQILDVPEINGARCLALEYVRGRSVAQILDRTRHVARRIPPEIAVFVISEVLEGLDHVHNARLSDGQPVDLVHRDVTPGNLLVSFEGDVKITDFGISKSVMSKVATTVGIVKGKARYLAPEQILGERASAQSDIFSTACVMFEMLTSIPLFDRASVPKTLTAIVHGEIPELRAVLPFPQATRLIELIGSALAVHQDKRPGRARDLARDLREAATRELGPLVSKAAVAAFMRQLFEGQDEAWELAAVPAEPHDTGVGTPSSPALGMERDMLGQDVDRRPLPPLRAGSIADDDAISGDAPPPMAPVSEPPPIRSSPESTLLVERARGRAAPTEVVVRATHGVIPQDAREHSVTPTFDGEEATLAVITQSPMPSRDDASTLAEITLKKLSKVKLKAPDESDDSTEAYDTDESGNKVARQAERRSGGLRPTEPKARSERSERSPEVGPHEPTRVALVRPDDATQAAVRSEKLIGTVPVTRRPSPPRPRMPRATGASAAALAKKRRSRWTRRPGLALLAVFVLGASTGVGITALLREKPVAPVMVDDDLPPPEEEPAPLVVEEAPVPSPTASAAAAPAFVPTIDVLYPRDARVRIDGRWLPGKVPLRDLELEPGLRVITVVWNKKKRDFMVEVEPGTHVVLGYKEFKKGAL